jgi:ubiquinone/menaquinone biosynthesis C-methylase UbiE
VRRVQREYARLAAGYDRTWSAYIAESTRRTVAALEPLRNGLFLDVGCGTGALLQRLRHTAPNSRLTGCDVSEPMLRVARSRLSADVALLACEAARLPFLDDTFHVVTSSSSLHYWPDVPRALSEIARVMRPGGSLVLTDWSGDYLRFRLLGGWLRLRGRAPTRSYPLDELARLLGEAGFRIEREERYSIGWFWRMVTLRARLG